jgi:hypothetical protein
MSANAIQWIVVLVYFLLFWGFTVAEARWLKIRGWAPFQRSFAFAIASNLFGFFSGSSIVFLVILGLFMLTYEPMTNPRGNEMILWVGVVLVFIIPPLLLTLVKRLLLKLFKMESGHPAWVFSMVSSALIVFGSVIVPTALLYVYLTFIDGPGK